MIKIYGIKNCDTVKKTINWMKQHNLAYHFHDYKKDGVDKVQLEKFVQQFGWQKVLNQRGTTWRKLSEEDKEAVMDAPSAIEAMQANASMIKRPLIDDGNQQLLGFNEADYRDKLLGE